MHNLGYYNLTPEIDPANIVLLGEVDVARWLDCWLWLKLFQLRQLEHTPIVLQALKLVEAERALRDSA
jgi:hypothetical protein